jgi:hypothetical protein
LLTSKTGAHMMLPQHQHCHPPCASTQQGQL